MGAQRRGNGVHDANSNRTIDQRLRLYVYAPKTLRFYTRSTDSRAAIKPTDHFRFMADKAFRGRRMRRDSNPQSLWTSSGTAGA